MHLKLILRRYSERFFLKEGTQEQEKGKMKRDLKKKKKKTERNGKRQKWKRKIEHNSESFRNKCHLRKSSAKRIKICFHLQVKEELLVFIFLLKYGLFTIGPKIYSQLHHITYSVRI